jgi:hypothetical protein
MPDKSEIKLYFHCRKCFLDKPKNTSMEDYSKLSIGKTNHGILIWCNRHNQMVASLAYDWNTFNAGNKCNGEQCKG